MERKGFCKVIYLLLLSLAAGSFTIGFGQERLMGGVGITVFEKANFKGKSATFQTDVPNLDGTGFNDKISSLRIGPNEQWEVCEHANYQGRCVVVSGEESDLKRNKWNKIISSFRRVGGAQPIPPGQGNGYIVVFEQPTYRGNPTNYDGVRTDLSKRAGSITIGKGVWEICDGKNFTGRCQTLSQSVADLRTLNIGQTIRSVRPVGSGENPQPPPMSDWYIVLYDQTTYRGNPKNYQEAVADLAGNSRRAQSVTIGKGVWELCEGKNFTGVCVTLDQSKADLGPMKRRISSVRPVNLKQPR